MLSPVRLSSVCNVRAPNSAGTVSTPFGIYLGHPLISMANFTEIIPGEPLRPGGGRNLSVRAVAKYSDFGPIEGYISETAQDRR